MEYTINGAIELSSQSKLRLSSDVDFISPSRTKVSLHSESDDKLSALLRLEAGSDNIAQELARMELSRICNVLSFYHNTSIYGSKVTGMSYIKPTSKGENDVAVIQMLHLSVTADVVLTLGNKSLSRLISNLQQDYPEDLAEVVYVWREALSKESTADRFFSLYRLMDYLFKESKKLDEWIKSKEPTVKRFPPNEFRRYEHTVYTYLRDNIHYKKEKKLFPLKEIQDNLPGFQALVKQAITERYKTLTSQP
jgi:hypothetical protein